MSGKEFKEFALMVPDSAIVEWNHYGWCPVDATKIRACVAPSIPADQEGQGSHSEASHA